MSTKRFPKPVRELIDATILAEAQEGRGQHDNLVEQVREILMMNCGNIMHFFTAVSGMYVSSRKQILRKNGLIDIGANLVAKANGDMDENDIHAAISRNNVAVAGLMVGVIERSHKYGDKENRDRFLAVLAGIDSEKAEALKRECGIVETLHQLEI